MTNRILRRLRRLIPIAGAADGRGQNTPRAYWTEHNVTSHHEFATPQESLEYFQWRNDQYFNYIELMPVAGFDGQRVMDYGCGPGHDLVGFGTFSRCRRLVGVDVSSSSIRESRARLALHGIAAEATLLDADTPVLPFEDGAFDHIHSSGVLHHTPDAVGILRELNRVLRPGGTANVMVYNYDSLWLHSVRGLPAHDCRRVVSRRGTARAVQAEHRRRPVPHFELLPAKRVDLHM